MKPVTIILGMAFLVLVLASIPLVVGLPCQYTEPEFYDEIRTMVVEDSTEKIVGPPLRIEDANSDIDGTVRVKIVNTLDQDVIINVTFMHVLRTTTFTMNYPETLIERYSAVDLRGNGAYDAGYYAHIPKESVAYVFVDPPNVRLKNVKVQLNRSVCTLCEGLPCLNDTELCTSDSRCGSGICNVNGLCDTERIRPCLSDLRLCGAVNQCVAPGVKQNGEFYDCEFECASQFGENSRCINPLTTILSVTEPNPAVGEQSTVTLSLDNGASKEIDANLVITISNGASLSAVTGADSCTPNLCKIFRKVPAKGISYVSVEATCETTGNVTFSSSITYGAESTGNTLTDSTILECGTIKPSEPPIEPPNLFRRFLLWLLQFV